jgi:hypothetical protein
LLDVFDFLSAVRILSLESPKVIRMVVMIADGNREDFLRFLLFDYEPVQMCFDVARQQMEFEFLVLFLSGSSSSSATAGSGSVIVATETLSPKFCFINSVILDFSSSGEGNGGVGGGGFCAM